MIMIIPHFTGKNLDEIGKNLDRVLKNGIGRLIPATQSDILIKARLSWMIWLLAF